MVQQGSVSLLLLLSITTLVVCSERQRIFSRPCWEIPIRWTVAAVFFFSAAVLFLALCVL